MPRLLFGPVDAPFADRYLSELRAASDCLTFGPGGDRPAAPGSGWEDVEAGLPAGWRPDLLVLWLPYTSVPPWAWAAAVPIVGLAPDWDLQWHWYRHALPLCDAVLTDSPGVEVMARAGLATARAANLFGLGRDFLEAEWPRADAPRDIDVLFVGNLHPAVQHERLPWVARLAGLVDRHRVVIRSGVSGAEYRALLARSKVVFNRSTRGECNRRAFEAAIAGAVLLQEAGNREVPRYLAPGTEYREYDADTLEAVVDGLLGDDRDRIAVAAAGQARARAHAFDALLLGGLAEVLADAGGLRDRVERRARARRMPSLAGRYWQEAGRSGPGHDLTLADDLAAAGAWYERGLCTRDSAAAETHFRRAGPHRLARVRLADALSARGDEAGAAEILRDLLADLDRSPALTPGELDAVPPPPKLDWPRAEWERAAWAHPADAAAEARAKLDLVRWAAHARLADLTGDVSHYYEAAVQRPCLPTTRAALGCALVRAGRPAAGLPHLRAALAAAPFDRAAARALYQLSEDLGRRADAAALADDRRRLHRAAPAACPAELWFPDRRPAGGELASVIVPCFNQADVTRRCLAGVLGHTRAPFELVLVDDGSTDVTPDVFRAAASDGRAERTVVVRHERNRGFVAAANAGLAAARGDFLVLLNNDTVVTAGWLDGLVRTSLSDYPRVGLVGPVSNGTRPPQRVEPGYADLSALDAFAAARRAEFSGRVAVTQRLTGFCLLLRRDVYERLGGLDERFGRGFFDDDDLSVRAARAGYTLLIAQDVYIHHDGSRTFGAEPDAADRLRENLERFRAKWGEAEAAGYRLPAALPGRPRVSLTMIVRNEERNLPACLSGLRRLFHEVVVVDTGSTDRTRETAAALGAKVSDFPWVDNFAAARNAALERATGDYAFWLDADDRLDDENRDKLAAVMAGLDGSAEAFVMKCRCTSAGPAGAATVVDHVRLFPRRPDVRWEHRVHEQILPALRRGGVAVRWADVTIRHVGYVDPALRRRKLDRDLRLLHVDLADRPGHPFTLFNLGSIYAELGDHGQAIECLTASRAASDVRDSIVRKLYALIAQSHNRLGRLPEAMAVVREGLTHYPADAELLFLDGVMKGAAGDLVGAEAAYLALLAGREGDHFGSVDDSLRGAKAHHNLAVLYLETGRLDEAAQQWRAAVAADPRFVPAWAGLAEAALRARDAATFAMAVGGLAELVPADAARLKARWEG